MKPMIKLFRTPMGYYFYETQRNEIVSVSKELYKYIEYVINGDDLIQLRGSSAEKEYKELVSYGYLQPSHIEKIKHSSTQSLELLMNRRIEKIYLQVTQRCNLRCEYCVYSEKKNLATRSHADNDMTFDTAKRAIEFYGEHSIDSDAKVIGFYGGEPLLNFQLIKQVIEYANDYFRGYPIYYTLTTNATLLKDDIIDFFAQNRVHVTVSLDGPKSIQNKNRRFANGEGTYDIVIRNLEKLKGKTNANTSFSISMVIDPDNDYDEIMNILNNPVLENAVINPSFIEEDGKTKPLSIRYNEQYQLDFFNGLLLFLRGDKTEIKNRIILNQLDELEKEFFKMRTSVLGNEAAPSGPCIPGKMRLFSDFKGELFPCERVSETAACMKIGDIYKGFNFDNINRLLNVAQLTADSCKNCWAFQLCSLCARFAVDNYELCGNKRREYCLMSKRDAYYKLTDKVLITENREHEKYMRKLLGERK